MMGNPERDHDWEACDSVKAVPWDSKHPVGSGSPKGGVSW